MENPPVEENLFGSWLKQEQKEEEEDGSNRRISSTTPSSSSEAAPSYSYDDSYSPMEVDSGGGVQDSILRRILCQDSTIIRRTPLHARDLFPLFPFPDSNNNLDTYSRGGSHKKEGKGVSWKAKPSWAIYVKDQKETLPPFLLPNNPYPVDPELNALVGLVLGDTCISKFAADAIVTCTNENFNCNPAADKLCLYEEGGPALEEVCRGLTGLPLGQVRVTEGFNLSAKYVIHTRAPTGDCPQWQKALEDTYSKILQIAEERGLRTIVFPCISMGYKTLPGIISSKTTKTASSLEPHVAAIIALKTVRAFLEGNRGKVDRIVLSLHDDAGIVIYRRFMQVYFPMDVT